MRVINANGETIQEARTKKALAMKAVSDLRCWRGQVSVEEFKKAGIKALDDRGREFPLSELEAMFDAEIEKAAARPQFNAPHLQGCSTPHRVRKPWHRW